jgi:hypothetical protein
MRCAPSSFPRSAWIIDSATEVRSHATPVFPAPCHVPLASMDRFEAIATREHARVIIRHDPRDIALLPRFPACLHRVVQSEISCPIARPGIYPPKTAHAEAYREIAP